MRTAGADLPLYQYLLLDVIAAILTTILAIIYVTYFMFRKFLSLICAREQGALLKKKQR
jgi:hypothetical protein